MKLSETKQKKKREEESVGQLHVFSYKLLNDHVKSLHPKLYSLEKNIKQAMMPIPCEVYVSSMVFFSMIAGICGAIMGIVAIQFVNIQPAIIGFLIVNIRFFAPKFNKTDLIPIIVIPAIVSATHIRSCC